MYPSLLSLSRALMMIWPRHNIFRTMNQAIQQFNVVSADNMEAVPTYIEIPPVDLDSMDHDYFTDDEDSYAEDELFDQCDEDDYDVTNQDLDALRRMVREIRDNPVLLLQSPIYSCIANPLTNNYSLNQSSPTQVAHTAPSLIADSQMPLARKTHVDPSFLCQECNYANVNVCSPSPTDRFYPMVRIQDIPPLPFRG